MIQLKRILAALPWSRAAHLRHAERDLGPLLSKAITHAYEVGDDLQEAAVRAAGAFAVGLATYGGHQPAEVAATGSQAASDVPSGAATIPILALPTDGEVWTVHLKGDRIGFDRYVNGRRRESYGQVDTARASIYAAAIIQGFQPPRGLLHSDTPAD